MMLCGMADETFPLTGVIDRCAHSHSRRKLYFAGVRRAPHTAGVFPPDACSARAIAPTSRQRTAVPRNDTWSTLLQGFGSAWPLSLPDSPITATNTSRRACVGWLNNP
jgi:hypothetical protein